MLWNRDAFIFMRIFRGTALERQVWTMQQLMRGSSWARSRIGSNSEARSAWQWLKATQHGHFYAQLLKEGTIWSASNYWAWSGAWVPEAAWVNNLW